MASVIILGAGLTGISTAYHLESAGFFDYVMLEKEPTIGGLCRSITENGFTFDYTGHLLHANDPYFKQLIESIIGLDHFNQIDRRSYVYSQNTYTLYPYQINLKGLPTKTIADCIEGFVNRPESDGTNSFYNWVMHNFGAGFAKHFFLPYQGKIFDYDAHKLSASWTGRFVPQTTLSDIINGITENNETPHSVGYNAHFLYPKVGGIYSWVDALARKLVNPVITNKECVSIDTTEKRITCADGEQYTYNVLINTMPLDTMLGTLTTASDHTLHNAAQHLLCNSVINFNIGLNRFVTDKHWIYFPEIKYPFYRLGFPSNFAASMAPAGCSSIYGEFAALNQPTEIISERLERSREAALELLAINPSEIVMEKTLYIPHAYVIYDNWRDTHLNDVLAQLTTRGIYSAGRYAEWKYSSMQEGVLDGKRCAETILTHFGFARTREQQPAHESS